MTNGARRPLVVGNWKLHHGLSASEALARGVVQHAEDLGDVEIAIAPVFTALASVARILSGSKVALSAQDVHFEDKGAFTGEVSAPLLVDVGCRFCIVGHSERRQYFGETDATVKKKVAALLRAGVTPIVCVGETLAQRDAGQAVATVVGQLDAIFDAGDGATLSRVVIAYEPVWAIGTGVTPTTQDVERIHEFIHIQLSKKMRNGGEVPRILYGGSVKPSNCNKLLNILHVNGALVGGASLKASDFLAIAAAIPK